MYGNGKTVSFRRALVVVSLFWLPLSLTTPAASQNSTITTIDDQGAGTGAQQGTAVTAVDAAGDIAGVYIDSNNVLHCFVRPAGGSISNCDVSGAGSSLGEGTVPTTINTSGVVAGSYIDGSQVSHGFVRAVNGTITKFDAPAASQSKNRGTTVLSINDSGVIIGTYTTGTYSTNSVYGGFMRSADGSTYTLISDPNAGTGEGTNSKKQGTIPVAMNASGAITGYYIDSNTVQHGFVRSASGTYTSIDPSGAGTCVNQNNGSNFGGTTASGIDAAGDVAGTYLDTSCAQHGFIRNANGTITSFDAPGADTNPCPTSGGSGEKICGTFFVVSDAVGDLTGGYIDTNGTIHSFLRPAATGTFTSFDDPNAYTSGALNGTLGIAISSQTSGIEIAGGYIDANSVFHGFIYTPALTATTTRLTPAPTPNPSIYQEPVTLTASVSSSGSAPPNGENVTFLSGTTTLGTAQLASGTASLTTTALPTGTDSITASYSGDSEFAGSTSAAVSQTVNKASSSTTLKSSLNPSTFGQSVTFTVNVSGQFSGVATGTVTFHNGSTSLGTASLSGDSAVLTTTALPAGTDSITAAYNGDSNFTGSTSNTVSQVVNTPPPAATPTFSVPAGTYTSAQSVTISDATAGATFYYTTDGTTPTTSSTKFTGAITVSSSETLKAIATASGYSNSAVATAAYVINVPANPVPVMSSMSPAYSSAGSAAFTLTITGSGFAASSTAYWGTSALATKYGSATQLTAQVTAADIANAGITAITVQTPTPGGGTSNSMQFEVDSAGSGTSTSPTFTSLTATVAAGSTASYAVTAPAGVTIDSVTCLNLPTGATCSYSSTNNAVTIATLTTTPSGTYQVTVVFTEAVPGAATAGILLPILLLPLLLLRRRLAARGIWLSACVGLLMLVATAFSTGCGGGASKTNQTYQATSSGVVSLTVK